MRRALRPGAAWRTTPIAVAFWLIDGGLALMVVMNTLRWLRVPGDTIFAVGALVLGGFVLGLATGWSLEKRGAHVDEGSTEEEGGPAEVPGRA